MFRKKKHIKTSAIGKPTNANTKIYSKYLKYICHFPYPTHATASKSNIFSKKKTNFDFLQTI